MSLKRRAHRKSRNGCYECKRRRIKCNEEQPRCGNCARHDVACVYFKKAESRAPSDNLLASERASPSTKAEQAAIPSTSSPSDIPYVFVDDGSAIPSGSYFNLKDMALLHHWTLVTSLSILKSPQLDHFWQTIYPEVGFQHAYVMHSILAITAIHTIYISPSKKDTHLCIAAHHHALALRGFRESINSIGPHNSEAIFASATLAFFYAFLTFGKIYDGQGDEACSSTRTSRVLGADWISLVRGTQAVLDPLHKHLRDGPLRLQLSLGNFYELDLDVQPGPDDDKFLALKQIWASDANSQVYDEALSLMRRTSAWMAQFRDTPEDQAAKLEYNREWSGPFAWLFLGSDQYFVLQQQRQPAALVLFAYFGALLPRLDGYWWVEGCGKSIVGAVEECLGPYWSSWLAWPKQVVGLE